MNDIEQELSLILERYSKRYLIEEDLYSIFKPEVWQGVQERQRKIILFLKLFAPNLIGNLKLLEIGAGKGGNILELLRLGFLSENLVVNELLPDRIKYLRENFPQSIRILEGDASQLDFEVDSFDIVYQSTVFSSILDTSFQQRLAKKIWKFVRPGGGILWYDFIFNNPYNSDVRGVPLAMVKELFPEAVIYSCRVTLAPPISRIICRIHPNMYHIFNALPFLRTHVLCWIGKKST